MKKLYNKNEAYELMSRGLLITHSLFEENEWMTLITDGKIITEDGVIQEPYYFWHFRKGKQWEDGYSVVENIPDMGKETIFQFICRNIKALELSVKMKDRENITNILKDINSVTQLFDFETVFPFLFKKYRKLQKEAAYEEHCNISG